MRREIQCKSPKNPPLRKLLLRNQRHIVTIYNLNVLDFTQFICAENLPIQKQFRTAVCMPKELRGDKGTF